MGSGAFGDEKFEEEDEDADEEADPRGDGAERAGDEEEAGGGGEDGGIEVVLAAEVFAFKGEAIKKLHQFGDEAKNDNVDCCKK